MQQIFKTFCFNHCSVSTKIIKIFINIILIMSLSSCAILFSKKNKKFFPQLNDIKINQSIKNIQNNSSSKIKNHHKISIVKKNNNLLKKSEINKEKKILTIKNILIQKNSNFFKSALESGLKEHEINNVIQNIQWKINFHKLNIGSSFRLLFLHNYSKNQNILLGIKINNLKNKYYFIRACNGNFYNINSINKKNCPINYSYLKKYRISSEFNLNRVNPVTHFITRHLGIDLAMPKGTPILATSNGRVVAASFNKIAGLYITLKNKKQYVTRYMHLNNILVKLGEKVKIGQKIALSGNTGRTTGPHLHYEIWVNNQPINPINSECTFSMELTKKEKEQYIKESKKILKYLN